MIILIGPSASGKTEIAKVLIKNYGFNKFVTTTTRNIRVNEVKDVDYHFISLNEFQDKINSNSFIEYVKYNDNYYGTYKNEISDDKVLILEPSGLKEFLKLNNPHIIPFFIETDKETREKRMINRLDDPKEIKKRLDKDDDIFNKDIAKLCKFIINNDDSKKTLEELANEIYILYKKCLDK